MKTMIKYKINSKMMKRMKQADPNDFWHGDIYDDIWTLQLEPNGKNNHFWVIICLSALSYNISQLGVQIVLKIFHLKEV